MNYRHIYHAGSFSDVFKHWVLTLILKKLQEKDAPFCVVDTHSGLGLYDLQSEQALKTKEFADGIQKFIETKNLPDIFKEYRSAVIDANLGLTDLNFYPGSPKITQYFLRHQDRLLLSELHPEDCYALNQLFKRDAQVKVLNQDGYRTIKSVLPPKEKRGLVIVDPPFEKTTEFNDMVQGVEDGLKRFSHGIYALWYPIKDHKPVLNFYKKLSNLPLPKCLFVEFYKQKPSSPDVLNGCGMVIINPPWQLDLTLNKHLPSLLKILGLDKAGSFQVKWIKKES